MAITSGTQVGPYVIGESIGVGGMGEVFRATDTKLKRDVAIKVLPDSFAQDTDRLARFQREAEILASLNHTNIAQIYGIEEVDGSTALIMELVEGPTLAERIAKGPIPPEEALNFAQQIINGLEAAHEQQVVHRDLKPANIKLKEDGSIKVLDFGIAKPMEGRAISGGSVSPSLTTPAMTETGLIMGTAAYMSPEQARGKRVDQRTDIWAFACVLFEMLTGQPAFGGEDITVTLARVIERDTDLTSIPDGLAPAVVHTLKLCFIKDPRKRIADIRDVRLALTGEFDTLDVNALQPSLVVPPWRGVLPVSIAAALVTGLAVWFVLLPGGQGTGVNTDVLRYTLPLNIDTEDEEVSTLYLGAADGVPWGTPALNALAFSNDGTQLAYVVWELDENQQQKSEIVLKRLDQERAVSVAETEAAYTPFFSPDDQWLAFAQDGAMKRISMVTGNIETILSDPENLSFGIWGAHWLNDGTIVYGAINGLYRVRDNGAQVETLLEIDRTEGEFVAFLMPHMLPGDNSVLFHTAKTGYEPDEAEIRVLDIETGEHSVILTDAQHPWYLAETGHLMFIRRGSLMAVAFDLDTLAPEGDPLLVLDGVVQAQSMPNTSLESGVAQLSYSPSGHLAYVSGGTYPKPTKKMVRIPPDGAAEIFLGEEYNYLSTRLSPDGSKIVFDEIYGSEGTIYIHDLTRGITQRLNTGTSMDRYPQWSPDGEYILYSTTRQNNLMSMYRIRANGSGDPERLAPEENVSQTAASWSVNGAIAYLQSAPGESNDIWILSPDGEPAPFVETDEVVEAYPEFSPDGNWLLYVALEEGTLQVYVRPYPGPGPATQISATSGAQPAWAPDGRSIFFVERIVDEGEENSVALMQVSFTPGDPPVIGRVEPYIENWPLNGSVPVRDYIVLEDGSILSNTREDIVESYNAGTTPLTNGEANGLAEIKVVMNFLQEMRRRVNE